MDRIWVLGIIILGLVHSPVLMKRKNLERFLKSYKWELYSIFVYAGITGSVGLFILNLRSEKGRVLFQGLIAFDLVLILFVELALDYLNRRRRLSQLYLFIYMVIFIDPNFT